MTGPYLARSPADFAPLKHLAGLTGLEFMQAVASGDLPGAPIAGLADMRLIEVAEGRVVFEGTPGFQHYNPMGGVHGGWFGILLDSAMGCAVMTRMPRGKGYTTLEYKVNILRGATEATGPLRAIGTAIHIGRRTATAEGRLEDAAGKLYATGTTTCLVLDLAP